MFRDDRTPTQSEITRRILGMKVWQAAVLAGFIILDIVVVVVGLALVMSVPAPAAPSAPVVSPQPPTLPPLTSVATAASTPTETMQPTETPTEKPFPTEAPDDTATPTRPAVPASWTEYTANGFTIQLPDSYAGGIPPKDVTAIVDSLEAKNAPFDLAKVRQWAQSYSQDTAFLGVDSIPGPDQFMVNLSIIYQNVDPDEPMADSVTRILGELAQGYTLSEQRQMINKYFEMQEVTMVPKDPALVSAQVAVYVMKSGDVLLGVICAGPVADWPDRLRQFDQIAKSIHLVQP
jgi:hypothetical protein